MSVAWSTTGTGLSALLGGLRKALSAVAGADPVYVCLYEDQYPPSHPQGTNFVTIVPDGATLSPSQGNTDDTQLVMNATVVVNYWARSETDMAGRDDALFDDSTGIITRLEALAGALHDQPVVDVDDADLGLSMTTMWLESWKNRGRVAGVPFVRFELRVGFPFTWDV